MPHSKLIEQRLRFLKFAEEDNYQTLQEVKDLVAANIDDMLDDFYDHILGQPELKALFRDEESLQKARSGQKSHWMRILFARKFGEKQFAEMKQVGETHVKVGLGPSWYLSAYCFMLNRFIDRIVEQHQDDPPKLKRVIQALNKAVVLDISFVIESYSDAKNASIKKVLRRATRFTEEMTQLTEDLNRTADDLKARAESLQDPDLRESSDRLSHQVTEMKERLDQLMYGDKLRIAEDRQVNFLTRIKAFIDEHM